MEMYSADTRLVFAMTRHLGLFTQYAFYSYMPPANATQTVLQRQFSRQIVSVGIQAWVPLVDKDKVPRDPR